MFLASIFVVSVSQRDRHTIIMNVCSTQLLISCVENPRLQPVECPPSLSCLLTVTAASQHSTSNGIAFYVCWVRHTQHLQREVCHCLHTKIVLVRLYNLTRRINVWGVDPCVSYNYEQNWWWSKCFLKSCPLGADNLPVYSSFFPFLNHGYISVLIVFSFFWFVNWQLFSSLTVVYCG